MYLILRRDFKMAVTQRETTPKLLGGDVCSVLHRDIVLNGADETPELLLHELSGNHLKHPRRGHGVIMCCKNTSPETKASFITRSNKLRKVFQCYQHVRILYVWWYQWQECHLFQEFSLTTFFVSNSLPLTVFTRFVVSKSLFTGRECVQEGGTSSDKTNRTVSGSVLSKHSIVSDQSYKTEVTKSTGLFSSKIFQKSALSLRKHVWYINRTISNYINIVCILILQVFFWKHLITPVMMSA